MIHTLSLLPYAIDALEPYISRETLEYHHGAHHQAYVTKLNELIANGELADLSLEEIILAAPRGPIFNNAAQVWNHTFYFATLAPPNTHNQISLSLRDAIEKNWGSLTDFQAEFSKQAIANFGSGWTWLVVDARGELVIVNTPNAENPLTSHTTPLLTCDVWEHAYYIDYRNLRAKYLENFWKIINWDIVSARYDHGEIEVF